MKKTILLISILAYQHISTLCFAQTSTEYVQQAKDLIAKLDETNAYPVLLKAVAADGRNMEALTMAAYYATREGNRKTDKEQRNKYYQSAKTFANAAVKLNPNDAEAQYLMAVALGRIALISSSKEKVAASRQIKEIIEKAIALNPKHSGAYHVLGKWHYEVYNLNMFEKAAISMLFGGLPTGDIKTSCINYAKALELKPTFLLYYLDYAKALKQNDQKAIAIQQLNIMLKLTPTTQDDAGIIKEAKELLEDWK